MFEDTALELPKKSFHCYERSVTINGQRVSKVFCDRCPLCNWKLFGHFRPYLSTDGSEVCSNPRCKYERCCFTAEECALLEQERGKAWAISI